LAIRALIAERYSEDMVVVAEGASRLSHKRTGLGHMISDDDQPDRLPPTVPQVVIIKLNRREMV